MSELATLGLGGGAVFFLAGLTIIMRAWSAKKPGGRDRKTSLPPSKTDIALLVERTDRHEEEIGELKNSVRSIHSKLGSVAEDVSFIRGKLE